MHPTPSPEGDAELMERILGHYRKMMRTLREAQDGIETVVGRGESADGLLTAVSDGHGRISKVALDPRAMRLDRSELGRRLTEVLQTAQACSLKQTREIKERLFTETDHMPQPLGEEFVTDRIERIARNLG
jgi:DNA-binding protein YbaB